MFNHKHTASYIALCEAAKHQREQLETARRVQSAVNFRSSARSGINVTQGAEGRKRFTSDSSQSRGEKAGPDAVAAVDVAPITPTSDSTNKGAINAEFYRQLKAILKIVLPLGSKQFALLVVHSTFLLGRTYLSILGARIDGLIGRTITMRDAGGFKKAMLFWFMLAVPAVFTNAMASIADDGIADSFFD